MSLLDGSPYQGYLYAYPHKTAYRPLSPRPRLTDVWAGEARDRMFLYAHVPFCEMRCGFCNLFTTANPPADQVAAFLAQLRREALAVSEALGPAPKFALGAIGGGTPTYLTADELAALLDILAILGPVPPLSVETSPATATPDRLALLVERGATRVSIGVQSFLDAEAHAAGRPQRRAEVERALGVIRAAGAVALNLDLIYGIAGQTSATWDASLRAALEWAPEELYLYPLYVRPLTGLARRRAPTEQVDADWDAQRLALYRQGRDTLRSAGYRQLSMRHFTRLGEAVDEYSCQDDGMVGLGVGARSYTTGLHYSFDYAVGVGAVRAIIDDYLRHDDFSRAVVGIALDEAEQRRRWLVKSLLRSSGVDGDAFAARFGVTAAEAFPELSELERRGWLAGLRLTDEGLARGDAIGPWLVSAAVASRMREYERR